jgi:hypothetical protein
MAISDDESVSVKAGEEGDSSEDEEIKKMKRKKAKEEQRLKRKQKYRGKTICKYCPNCVKCLNWVLNNKFYIGIMTFITIYALLVDDIRIMTCPKEADVYFWGITSFVLISFLIELLMSSLAIDGYMFGFYFWLDFIATISLVSDIGWIWNSIFATTSIDEFQQTGTTTGIDSARIRGAKTGTTIG